MHLSTTWILVEHKCLLFVKYTKFHKKQKALVHTDFQNHTSHGVVKQLKIACLLIFWLCKRFVYSMMGLPEVFIERGNISNLKAKLWIRRAVDIQHFNFFSEYILKGFDQTCKIFSCYNQCNSLPWKCLEQCVNNKALNSLLTR